MDRGTENDRIVNAFDNIVKKELNRVEKELNRFKKRLGETRLQGSNGNNEKAELWNIAGLLIFGNKSDANNTIQETSEMSSEKSVPGEGAREAELQAAPVTGPSDTSPVTSSAPADNTPEIAEDTAPATSTAQDHNIPEITGDTAPATCTAQDHNIPEITGDTAPVTSTAQDHNIPEITGDTAPATSTAQDYNIPEITGDTAPVTSTAQDYNIPEITGDTAPATCTAQDHNIPEITGDTAPVTCTAQDHNIPEITGDTAPVTCTAQDHNIPEITGDTAPATTAQDHNIPEIAEDTAPVTSTAQDHNIPEITGDTAPVTTAQDHNIPETAEDTASVMGPSHTSPVESTPPDSTVPEDPANSPSTTPASVSPPGEIKIDSVEIDSVSLSWGSPDNMYGIPHSFHITYSSSDKSHQDMTTAPSNSTVISKLRPGREYSFTVTTVLKNGTQSTPVSTSVCTKPSPPGEIKIDSVEIDSVSLSWSSPDNMDGIPHTFYITYSSSDKSHQDMTTAPSNSTVISKLRPGREYSFTVTTVLKNGIQSRPVSTAVCTKPSPPGKIKIDSVEIDSVSLSWGRPAGMKEIPHSFKITYSSSAKDNTLSITAPSNSTVISKMRPGREYSFTVTTVLENGTQSTPVSTSVCTKSQFVDEHRCALIQRVVSVETIADALLEKRMLQETQYDEILAEKVSSAQMRLLYKFARAWGNSEKDVFLEILKEQQPHLIKDLQGD
ncbi:mucin-2-like [Acipenser ruthenus]|uniref:mucin-2-like n=1 Tax=Acipenser ruthenus TaxID=7906 RepID=UPI002740E167|nr:mucin-2-like [Acipenser ruthenus]